MEKLELHKSYRFDDIEAFAEENELLDKVDGFLQPLDAYGDVVGEIGEIVLPLYFGDGSVAANFILTGYGSQSSWRCIYTCQALSSNGRDSI